LKAQNAYRKFLKAHKAYRKFLKAYKAYRKYLKAQRAQSSTYKIKQAKVKLIIHSSSRFHTIFCKQIHHFSVFKANRKK
jgi:hypothetical protein